MICGEIKTLLRRVPKEDALTGVRGELMGSSGRGVRVAGTPGDL
jgi:hypothetical protein